MQLVLRFLIGGLFVSLFSVLGDSFKPKSFAGLFGAAPSIALAGFVLQWSHSGATTAALEARSMIFGAIAMLVYSASCAWAVRHDNVRPWLATGLLWIEWLAIALGFYWVMLR